MRLENKMAIVTGAASGFGKASAEMFAKEGAKVAAVDIDGERLERVVEGINAAGGEAYAIQCDISKSEDVRKMIEEAAKKLGGLNVLFNNAGIEHMNWIVETTEEDFDRVVSVNFKGTWLCTKYAIPYLIEAGGGSMIHTSSLSALKGRAGNSLYGAAKAAILQMSQVLAVELAPQKIRSNCLCPVVADTPMGERFLALAGQLYNIQVEDKEQAKVVGASTIPLGRLCTPEDVAYAAVYLASDESSLVSGIYLLIDGASRAG